MWPGAVKGLLMQQRTAARFNLALEHLHEFPLLQTRSNGRQELDRAWPGMELFLLLRPAQPQIGRHRHNGHTIFFVKMEDTLPVAVLGADRRKMSFGVDQDRAAGRFCFLQLAGDQTTVRSASASSTSAPETSVCSRTTEPPSFTEIA